MKLYLSSFMLGDHNDQLIAMAGRGARMAIITNALDYIPVQAQIEHARNKWDPNIYFMANGFDPSTVDLRHYFGRTQELRQVLLRFKVIWALGGNAFLLRRAMHESGFEDIIRGLLTEGTIYGGWSAGACVAGDSLRAIEVMDDPGATAPGYGQGEPIWDGLNLVPFSIIPHFRSNHPEAATAERAVQWARDHAIKFEALQDGAVILANDTEPEVLDAAN
jgi:dipeptidase E